MELLVAVALMAILATIAIPSVRGFASKGKGQAYNSDLEVLQVGVDVWRTSVGRSTGRVYPILLGGVDCLGKIDLNTGLPTESDCNPYIDLGAIATEGLLQNAAAIKSADVSKNTTATNSPSGNYGWYISTDGLVTSQPVFTEGVYP